MGPPFVLGIGNSGLYQDGKFVQAFVDRCSMCFELNVLTQILSMGARLNSSPEYWAKFVI